MLNTGSNNTDDKNTAHHDHPTKLSEKQDELSAGPSRDKAAIPPASLTVLGLATRHFIRMEQQWLHHSAEQPSSTSETLNKKLTFPPRIAVSFPGLHGNRLHGPVWSQGSTGMTGGIATPLTLGHQGKIVFPWTRRNVLFQTGWCP